MKRGIDVSEWNKEIDWGAVAEAGIEFAIVRLGYGKGHLDSKFFDNINGALNAGLKVGAYYYSYALSREDAEREAEFFCQTLKDAGLTNDDLEAGVWLDMEDADHYKERNGVTGGNEITDMCFDFVLKCNTEGYNCGIYASLDWMDNIIDKSVFADYVPYFVAEWGDECSFDGASVWQYTNHLKIGENEFDGDIMFDD